MRFHDDEGPLYIDRERIVAVASPSKQGRAQFNIRECNGLVWLDTGQSFFVVETPAEILEAL